MAIAFVQAKETVQTSASLTTVAATYTSNLTAGSLIVASVIWKDAGSNESTSATIADTLGQTWTVIASAYDAVNGRDARFWYFLNTAAGANTVTVTLPGSRQYRGLMLAEYSGILTAAALDGSSLTSGATTTGADSIVSGNVVTTGSGDLIYGCLLVANDLQAVTVGTGYTERLDASNGQELQDKVLASGTTTSTWAYPDALNRYMAYAAGFKAAGAGGAKASDTPFVISGRGAC